MSVEVYKEALDKAVRELEEAIKQRDNWTLEVAKLEQLVKSLSVVSSRDRVERPEKQDEVGFQDVIFTCIRKAEQAVSATDVREMLNTMGFDLSRYSNPLALIHGAMKRLETALRIKDVKNDGKYVAIEYPSAESLRQKTREMEERIIRKIRKI